MSSESLCFTIYTDGSFLPKTGQGSWAFVLVSSDAPISIEKSGTAKATTSNRMEFQAALEALKLLPPDAKAIIYSDSRNLIDTMTLWLPKFRETKWKKKSGRPIPDNDLIRQLEILAEGKSLTWLWVKAHAGHALNERCDTLCDEALGRAA